MSSGTHPLQGALQALTVTPRGDGLAPVIAITSGFSKSGTSHVSRELALLAASNYGAQGGRAALIDLDINNQSQAAFFDTPQQIAAHGALSGPYDATFGETPFWQVSPDMMEDGGMRSAANTYCGLYMLGVNKLVVSKFNWQAVKQGQSVHVVNSPHYWQAIRNQFSIIFVDCPSFEDSDIAINIVPYADKTIIVSPEHKASDPINSELSYIISNAGGYCAGLVLNAGMPAHNYTGHVS